MLKWLYLIGLLFIQKFGIAQMKTPYSFGCVSFSEIESNSNALQFNSTSKCMLLQTGVYVYGTAKKYGPFQTVCLENGKESFVTVVAYPNPVINKLTLKTLSNSINQESYQVSIFSVAGVRLFQRTITEEELLIGYQVDCTNYAAGSYVVYVNSKKFSEQYQFIKRHQF